MAEQSCPETRALRFQRVVLGGLLFGAYALDYAPLVVLVVFVMLLGCASTRCSPIYQLGLMIAKSKRHPPTGCVMDQRAERFSCALGLCVATTGLVFIHLGKAAIGWSLVLLVGSLSVLAGTAGLCVGAVLYALVFKKHGDGIP